MFSTIEEIAQDFVSKLGVGDLDLIQYSTDVHAEILMKCHIRNHYGLWTDNPLTELWRTEPELRHIKDGIDYSPDHPDQISELILQRVYKIVRGEMTEEEHKEDFIQKLMSLPRRKLAEDLYDAWLALNSINKIMESLTVKGEGI